MWISLRLKFICAALLCFGVVMLIGTHRLNQLDVAAFEREVHNRTALVSEFGKATQTYIAEQSQPATEAQTDALVLESMSSFYATRYLFEQFNQALPNYLYRSPSLNPLNPLDQADDFETDLIRQFQRDYKLPELSGYREKDGREKFYIAKPITVEASCLKCHARPEDAPPEIVERYGSETGYHWPLGEIISASIIYVPTADIRASQAISHHTIIGTLFGLIAALAGTLYVLFEGLINRRIVRISKVLKQRTLVPNAPTRLKDTTRDEVGMLSRQFNQMANALDVAYENLENTVADRTQELTKALDSLKSTQTKLIQAEKMSSLGKMVGGVAHEINNPANFIHGNLTYVKEYVQTLIELIERILSEIPPEQLSEDLKEDIEEIDLPFLETDVEKLANSMQNGSERIRDIVKSLRNFARLDEAEFKSVDLHEGIESTLAIVNHRLDATEPHSRITLQKEYAQLPLVNCFPGELNQALLHILNNAIDAVEALQKPLEAPSEESSPDWSPHIIIKTDQITRTQPNGKEQGSTSCRICIIDNGVGISKTVYPFIFDPFYTTKPIGDGTGLGLAIAHQIIVETHSGELTVVSTPGQGTAVTIVIPQKIES